MVNVFVAPLILDNNIVHECLSCIDSRFSIVVKECDEKFNLGRNECFDFFAL